MHSKIVYYLVPSLLATGGVVLIKNHKTPEGVQSVKYVTQNLSLLSSSISRGVKNTNKPAFEIVTPDQSVSQEVPQIVTDESAEIQFCGEKVPLEFQHVLQKFENEIRKNKEARGSLLQSIKIGNRYKAEILRTLKENGIPEDFFYLAMAESGLNNLTSPRGAKGFWQFMEDAATRSGLEISATVDERLHPQKATLAAAKYLKSLRKYFKSWTLTAASYNMGAGGLMNAMNSQGKDDYYSLNLNPETSQYIYRIVALKYLMEQPQKFDVNVNIKAKYAPIPYYIVKVNQSISDLAEFARENNSNLKTLKSMNPWLIADNLEVKSGKVYEIRFPKSANLVAEEMLALPYRPGMNRKDLRDSILKSFNRKEKAVTEEPKPEYTF
ncbi:MAG: lytic transglycosylase domain-containing protein [Bacteroidia bacterium]|nr:lytic transglycosylase domain-containing protein [Bacteroidia bacterium]